MKSFIIILVVIAVGFFIFKGIKKPTENNPTQASSNSAIQIMDFAFSPSSLNVKAGTTVVWTNNDSMAHTVTADDKSFSSGNLSKGQTYSYTFTTAGTYAYHCALHPGMTGTIVVQ